MFETLALTDKEYLSLLGPDGNLKDTASQAPLHVVGIAYAEKLKASGRIVLTFMGEGATSQGVVFYVKNNQWAISLPTEKRTAGRTLAEKACAYGFESIRVDGNDLLAVYAATIAGARIAREKGRPVPIEGYTYRLGAHTTADDPKLYRDETQVAAWLDKDPLIRLEKYLAGKGLLTGKAQAELAAAALEVPLVVRMPYGGGIGAPAHHSESPEGPQSFGVAAEIPSPRSGVIRKLGAGPDQPVRVGEILARIEIADGKDSSSERKAVSAAQRLVRRRAADRRASRQGQHRFRHGYRAGPGRTGRRKGGRADPAGDPGTGRPAPQRRCQAGFADRSAAPTDGP